jgi:Bacterial Ig domain
LPFSDNLSGSNVISGLAGSGRGSNVSGTREPGEPDHANERGTHSVWLTWQPPPPAGVATIDTAGSSFDTLLAVYTGTSFSNLKPVASNDDVNSCEDPTDGFHTSRVSFNAKPGQVYHIAVDGLADAAGDIVLSWNLVAKDHLKPSVDIGPKDRVGLPGDQVRLSASVDSTNPVTEQWYFNCQPIAGATQTNLLVDNLQRSKVGNYVVRVRHTQSGEETLSDPTSVQINITDGRLVEIAALDKFPEASDIVTSNPLRASRLQKATTRSSAISKMSGGPARGYRGTQIFSTVGATKDPGEPNHCGQSGGASEWFAYQPPANGLLVLDTDGSDFDTVLAVYTGPGTDFQSLVPVACDNNSGSDGKTSKVMFQATKDTVYYIAVDGVSGAVGTVVLNYVLNPPNTPPTISSIAGQTTDEDTPLAGVAFTVNDAQTDSTNLVVIFSSSDPALVPIGNITMSGSGSNRTMAITPVTNQNGTATITLTVADPEGASASSSFVLTVNPVNDPPTISSVANQSTNEDTPTPAIPFSIGDVETPAGSLTITGHSSDQGLVPDANIVFGGSGSNRAVTIRPATNQFGTALVTITVTDSDSASVEWIDTSVTNNELRFYRAVH